MRARTVLSGLPALLRLTVLLLALAALDGCKDSPAKPVGTEGAACYAPTPRCNAELVCRDGVCVKGTNDDASAPDGTGGAAGSDAGTDAASRDAADGGPGDTKPADTATDAAADAAAATSSDAASSEASATDGGDAGSEADQGD